MSDIIRIKRGLDIKLKGKAEKIYRRTERPFFVALKPEDFVGLTPKLTVKPGDEVKTGSVLFYDKDHPEIKFTSPVTGIVSEIHRGERRRILEVIVKTADEDEFLTFNIKDPEYLSREEVITVLLESGMWPALRQRPYSIVARPSDIPKAIFISGFDSAPLAPDIDFIIKDNETEFRKGIDVLSTLTKGQIHLSVEAGYPICKSFANAGNVNIHKFSGPHPAGNIGVQIHHIDPLNKAEVIWYISPYDVVRTGRLFINGRLDNTLVLALTGSGVIRPAYVKTIVGACINSVVNGNVNNGDNRIISGNVLTGTRVETNGFIGFYDHQITVIPEGKHHEFVGWASPGFKKFSFYRAFWSWLRPDAEYDIDTNLKGGERAFVLTGLYEKVIPLDIYPMHLLKAIMVEDIDNMEKLGIYEVDPEDFSLAEFICPSKMELQDIIRKGLDLIRKETE